MCGWATFIMKNVEWQKQVEFNLSMSCVLLCVSQKYPLTTQAEAIKLDNDDCLRFETPTKNTSFNNDEEILEAVQASFEVWIYYKFLQDGMPLKVYRCILTPLFPRNDHKISQTFSFF